MKRWRPYPTGSCTGFLRGEIETEHVLPDVSYIIFPVRDEILVIFYDNDQTTITHIVNLSCQIILLYVFSEKNTIYFGTSFYFQNPIKTNGRFNIALYAHAVYYIVIIL